MSQDTCGPSRNCAWRRATVRSLRGQPTNTNRFCIALTNAGDPCGERADFQVKPATAEDRLLGQPFCSFHYHLLHQHFFGEQPERAPIVERDPEPQPEPKPGHVYFARRGEKVKIGFTTEPKKRIAALETMTGARFDETVVFEADARMERQYHERFQDARHLGEWFKVTPDIEAVMADIAESGYPTIPA